MARSVNRRCKRRYTEKPKPLTMWIRNPGKFLTVHAELARTLIKTSLKHRKACHKVWRMVQSFCHLQGLQCFNLSMLSEICINYLHINTSASGNLPVSTITQCSDLVACTLSTCKTNFARYCKIEASMD